MIYLSMIISLRSKFYSNLFVRGLLDGYHKLTSEIGSLVHFIEFSRDLSWKFKFSTSYENFIGFWLRLKKKKKKIIRIRSLIINFTSDAVYMVNFIGSLRIKRVFFKIKFSFKCFDLDEKSIRFWFWFLQVRNFFSGNFKGYSSFKSQKFY